MVARWQSRDVSFYESWVEKHDPQRIPPFKWTRLRWPKGERMTVIDGRLHQTVQLTPALTDGVYDPTYLKVRLTRDADPTTPSDDDATAIGTYTVPDRLKAWALPPHTTFMTCRADTPLAVDVYHNGAIEIIMGNRVFKVWGCDCAEEVAAQDKAWEEWLLRGSPASEP